MLVWTPLEKIFYVNLALRKINYLAYRKFLLLNFVLINLKSFMARAMLEYTKTVLKKVSFDVSLFCKEVKKAVKRLLPYELDELRIFIDKLIKQNPELSQCLIYLKT